jgi:hypothetical protein
MAAFNTKASPELIRVAAKLHDLDDACQLIQGSLGIASDKVASEFFSESKAQEWSSLSEASRLRMLVDYVSTEHSEAHP